MLGKDARLAGIGCKEVRTWYGGFPRFIVCDYTLRCDNLTVWILSREVPPIKVLKGPEGGYHMWAAEMTEHCGVGPGAQHNTT